MRPLIGVETLALNDRGKVNDVVIGHLHTVALLDLGLAAGKVKRLVLGLKLIEHGANHFIGRRRIAQRIGLGEQEALERIVCSTPKEAIIVHVIGGLGLVEEVFLRDAVVGLGHTVGDLIDRQALGNRQRIGARVGAFHELLHHLSRIHERGERISTGLKRHIGVEFFYRRIVILGIFDDMVLGENRGDRIARSTVGNGHRNLLTSRDLRILAGKEALDDWHDKENDRDKRKHGDNATDNHRHRGAFLLGTTAGVRVIARSRGRSNAVRAMSVIRMRLGGLRSLDRCLLLKAGTACRLGCTSSGLLTRPLSRLGRTRGGLHRARGRLSCALCRLCRTLARLGRARHRLSCTNRLARIGSARHARPPRFYDQATSAKTG